VWIAIWEAIATTLPARVGKVVPSAAGVMRQSAIYRHPEKGPRAPGPYLYGLYLCKAIFVSLSSRLIFRRQYLSPMSLQPFQSDALPAFFSALPSAFRSRLFAAFPTCSLIVPVTSWKLPLILSFVLDFICFLVPLHRNGDCHADARVSLVVHVIPIVLVDNVDRVGLVPVV
jgi:hypothetical protein